MFRNALIRNRVGGGWCERGQRQSQTPWRLRRVGLCDRWCKELQENVACDSTTGFWRIAAPGTGISKACPTSPPQNTPNMSPSPAYKPGPTAAARCRWAPPRTPRPAHTVGCWRSRARPSQKPLWAAAGRTRWLNSNAQQKPPHVRHLTGF